MYRYNCLLIDLDHTLLDFQKGEEEALHETFLHFNIPTTQEAKAMYERINTALWRSYEKREIKKEKLVTARFNMLLSQLNLHGEPAAINDFYFEKLAKAGYPYHGAAEMLEAAAEGATVAIITNGDSRVQGGRIDASGLAPYIDLVINSEDAGAAKPAGKFFTYALEKLGVTNKPKILVVGDSLSADIAGGNGFGVDTCWYNPGCLDNDTDIKPTYTAENYDEVLQILMGEDWELYASEHKKF